MMLISFRPQLVRCPQNAKRDPCRSPPTGCTSPELNSETHFDMIFRSFFPTVGVSSPRLNSESYVDLISAHSRPQLVRHLPN